MKYSVIIPVYNAEETLCRCVDSLVNQHRDDAEIILINDGSQDNSANICRDYADRYPAVKFIDKENGGVSTARTRGLQEATGKYITFVDSDDWVADNYFSMIDAALEIHDYDFVQFSRKYVNGEKSGDELIPPFDSNNNTEIFRRLAEDMWKKRINTPNGKVYKRSIIEENNIRFLKNLSVGEDRTFNIEYSLNVNSFRCIEEVLYLICLENEESLSRKKRDDLDEQIDIAEKYLEKLIEKSTLNEEEKDLLLSSIYFDNMRAVYTKAKYLHRSGEKLSTRLKELKKYCKAVNNRNFSYPKNKFCTLISLPVRFCLTPIIDAMGWVLTR